MAIVGNVQKRGRSLTPFFLIYKHFHRSTRSCKEQDGSGRMCKDSGQAFYQCKAFGEQCSRCNVKCRKENRSSHLFFDGVSTQTRAGNIKREAGVKQKFQFFQQGRKVVNGYRHRHLVEAQHCTDDNVQLD